MDDKQSVSSVLFAGFQVDKPLVWNQERAPFIFRQHSSPRIDLISSNSSAPRQVRRWEECSWTMRYSEAKQWDKVITRRQRYTLALNESCPSKQHPYQEADCKCWWCIAMLSTFLPFQMEFKRLRIPNDEIQIGCKWLRILRILRCFLKMVDFRLESFEGRFPKVAKLSTWNWADLNLKLFLVERELIHRREWVIPASIPMV